MADSYLGEIRMVGFNFPPVDWASCDGRLVSRDDFPELFELIGTTYGGDGAPLFGLPDLQCRIPLAAGSGRGLTTRTLGEPGGAETVTLSEAQMPSHKHRFNGVGVTGDRHLVGGALIAEQDAIDLYLIDEKPPAVAFHPSAIAKTGGSEAHDNIQQYLVLNFVISLRGAPPRTPAGGAPDPFLGEIRLLAGEKPPNEDWAICDGRLLAVSQNIALFALLATTFGGNG